MRCEPAKAVAPPDGRTRDQRALIPVGLAFQCHRIFPGLLERHGDPFSFGGPDAEVGPLAAEGVDTGNTASTESRGTIKFESRPRAMNLASNQLN